MSSTSDRPTDLGDLNSLVGGSVVIIDNKAWYVENCVISTPVSFYLGGHTAGERAVEVELRLIRAPREDKNIEPWLKNQVAR